MVDLYQAPTVYERVIHDDLDKMLQIRLTVNTFRDVEYLHLRKYYKDFMTEDWAPSSEGIAMPLGFDNCRELFAGLVEILSLAESKDVIETHFKDLIDLTYIK